MAKTPNYQTRIEEEHRSVNGVEAKAVVPYSYDGTNLSPIPSGFIPSSYDYVQFDPSAAQPTTMTFKMGGPSGTTVATVSLTYSGTDIASIYRT